MKKVSDTELLSLVLSGSKTSDIAKEVGLTVSQVSRRINAPEFKDLLKLYRNKIIEGTSVILASNAQKAAQALVDLIDDKNPYLRFYASTKVLSINAQYSLQTDLISDIERLKQQAGFLNDV